MHVGVAEAGNDAAAAQVDPLGAGQGPLVDADTAGDLVARDRERPGNRERPVERADRAVLEDHEAAS